MEYPSAAVPHRLGWKLLEMVCGFSENTLSHWIVFERSQSTLGHAQGTFGFRLFVLP